MSELIVDQLSKSYSTNTGASLPVLSCLSFRLAAGESMAVIGPSGTGKSTLLHLLGTLDQPTSGTIRYDGIDPFGLSEPQLAQFRNLKIGMIFQDHHLLPQLTVLENTLIPALAQGTVAAEAVARAQQLLARVGLQDRVTHFPGQLSGGERQRVAVARALLNRPIIMLADEPTGSLDRKTADVVGNLLVELQQEERTILITVTHTPALAEKMQRRFELIDGTLNEV